MHLMRKRELSVYYLISGLFNPYSFINVVDAYPDEDMSLPTIAVEGRNIGVTPYELGNRVGLKNRLWTIDVFAENKDQQGEFTYLILDELEDGIPVYDYDEGFPPSISPSRIGTLEVLDIESIPIYVFPQLVEKLYWRTRISFVAKYNPI
jgi:hypothetical protein